MGLNLIVQLCRCCCCWRIRALLAAQSPSVMTRSGAAAAVDMRTQDMSGNVDGWNEGEVGERDVDVDRMCPSSRRTCRPGLQD